MSHIRDFFTGQRTSQKPQRNFIKENIKCLKEPNKKKVSEPAAVKSGQFPKQPFLEIKDNFRSGFTLRRDGSNLSLKQSKLKDSYIREFSTLPTGFRHQSSQTIEENDLESLYHEGVIRFPTNRSTNEDKAHVKLVRTISLQTETPVHSRSPSPSLSGSPAGDSVKDFVKMNAMVQVQSKKKMQHSIDPTRPPPNYQMGVLPKYLREQKKEHEKLQRDMQTDIDPECPPGHSVLPDEERVKHLAQLKQRYLDLVSQLNSLPVRTDTLRTRRRRMEIEKELDKIDAGIKLFSRDKLFIKVGG
ncbi:uncharacterized protein LOC142325979 [Lycorma delicatula]|uniref:uncharacterized protein LOC142325979 n=1 Tax=Lycorma delicatula TaxID=130591 RepID=UPI003F5168D3